MPPEIPARLDDADGRPVGSRPHDGTYLCARAHARHGVGSARRKPVGTMAELAWLSG